MGMGMGRHFSSKKAKRKAQTFFARTAFWLTAFWDSGGFVLENIPALPERALEAFSLWQCMGTTAHTALGTATELPTLWRQALLLPAGSTHAAPHTHTPQTYSGTQLVAGGFSHGEASLKGLSQLLMFMPVSMPVSFSFLPKCMPSP